LRAMHRDEDQAGASAGAILITRNYGKASGAAQSFDGMRRDVRAARVAHNSTPTIFHGVVRSRRGREEESFRERVVERSAYPES